MEQKKKSLGKKIFLFLVSAICLSAAFIALLPWIASTQTGKNALLSWTSGSLPGTTRVQSISLSWQGPQIVESLQYESNDGRIRLSCDEACSDSSLLRLIFASHDIGSLRIQKPQVELHQTLIPEPQKLQPQVHAASLLGSIRPVVSLPFLKVPFIGNLELSQGKLSIFSEGIAPIIFDSIACSISSEKKLSNLSIHITGNTLQNGVNGSIRIDSDLKRADSPKRSLETAVTIQNFPVDGMDQILSLRLPSYRHLLTQAIGASLDMECNLHLSQESFSSSFQIQSENLQTHIQTAFEGNQVHLSSPGTVHINLVPTLMKKLQKEIPLLLPFASNSPISLALSLDSLAVPQTEKGFSFDQASFSGKLELFPYKMASTAIDLSAQGTFSSQKLSDEVAAALHVNLAGKTTQSISTAHISCQNPLHPSSRELIASLQMGKTPTSLINDFFPWATPSVFGDWFEGSLSLKGSGHRYIVLPVIKTPLLQTIKGGFSLEKEQLSLLQPMQIDYLIHPGTSQNYFKQQDILLEKPSQIKASISYLDVDLLNVISSLQLKAEVSTASITFANLFSLKDYSLEDASLTIQTDSLSQVDLFLNTPTLTAKWNGGYTHANRTVSWEKPIKLTFRLSDKELVALYPKKVAPTLIGTPSIGVDLDPSQFSLDHLLLDQLKLSGSVYAKELSFESPSQKRPFNLDNLQGSFQLQNSDQTFTFSISSDVKSPSLPTGSLTCEGAFKEIGLSSPPFKIDLTLRRLPSAMINIFYPTSIAIAPLIGPSIDLELFIEKEASLQSFWINGKTAFIKAVGGLLFDEKGIYLSHPKTPLEIEYLLTPEAYSEVAHLHQSPFILTKNTLLTASLKELSIPFTPTAGSTTPDFKNLRVQLAIENDTLTFCQKQTKQLATLEGTKLLIEKNKSASPLSLSLDTTSGDGKQKGLAHVDAQFNQILDQNGALQLQQMKSQLHATLQGFSTSVIDLMIPVDKLQPPFFSGLLGPSVTMEIKTAMQNAEGPLSINLSAKNVNLFIDGKVENGFLTLNKEASAQMSLTPETSEVFLKRLDPLSIASLSAPAPLVVEVSPKDFSFPLFPFSADKVNIPGARILPGKIFCQNEGNLTQLLSLLKSKKIRPHKPVEVWIAPLDISIRKGILNLGRTEILLGSTYDLACWGQVNFPGNRVDMILGLTSSCLKLAFGIRGLPSDYVLHIPMRGTLDHVDIDKKTATSKIVALTIWQNKSVVSSAAEGFGGKFFGGVIDQVLQPPGNSEPTPPAKEPFPWQQ